MRDEIAFGLQPGGELEVQTTICREVREARAPVVIDHAEQDNAYCGHPTPAKYGFQSYVSMAIVLPNGTFFGTLCAIDPRPARVNTPATIGMFKLFAELFAFHLDAHERLPPAKPHWSANGRVPSFVSSSSQYSATTSEIRFRRLMRVCRCSERES